ncbi:methylamine utilization protein [Alkalimonas collagenimarina]|uniref:Methylamine utilization protein n=1 Tax=Alkalimonas collagenimarina TaxID=400390 RepID=A0ABT9GYI2_9GAMM|nr:methylamine utilization protein [Alkalimonas collagenimarina]MDP4536111.1 methylamine utilization protein [Alkalimonas collagenimarina]
MTLSIIFTTLCLLCSVAAWNATAEVWQFTIMDQHGEPLDDAVVELVSLDTTQSHTGSTQQATIKQQSLNFVPFVSAVQVGTLIDFPNFDRTRHHVYSFSAAKVFEIQLYHDRPEEPIEFDTAGIVALGCNIHDYMEAYVYVSESPLVAVTDEQGQAHFTHLPAGDYQLTIWHPFQQHSLPPKQFRLTEHNKASSFRVDVTHRPKQPTPQRGFGS